MERINTDVATLLEALSYPQGQHWARMYCARQAARAKGVLGDRPGLLVQVVPVQPFTANGDEVIEAFRLQFAEGRGFRRPKLWGRLVGYTSEGVGIRTAAPTEQEWVVFVHYVGYVALLASVADGEVLTERHGPFLMQHHYPFAEEFAARITKIFDSLKAGLKPAADEEQALLLTRAAYLNVHGLGLPEEDLLSRFQLGPVADARRLIQRCWSELSSCVDEPLRL